MRTLEKFSTKLLEGLLNNEGAGVDTIQSESILIITQVVVLPNTSSGVETVNLPVPTGELYPVTLSLPLEVAALLATNGRLAVSNMYK